MQVNNFQERSALPYLPVPALDEEIEFAVILHAIARRDSRIEFEATNHYAYTLQDLREKTLNCEALRRLWAVKSI